MELDIILVDLFQNSLAFLYYKLGGQELKTQHDNKNKSPPPSLEKAKTYERFKQEVLAWREITDLAKNKQGIAVALSLPEDNEHQIKDKVFDQISIDDLKDNFGQDILIAFLDKHLAKDDLAVQLRKI